MKRLIAALLCLVLGTAAGAPASSPSPKLPLYGSAAKVEGPLAKRQQALLAAAAKAGQDARDASAARAETGWKLVSGKRYDAAMAAFNEAWLLDAHNGDAFYGLATVALRRDRDTRNAERLFRLAVEQPVVPPDAFVDYGQLLLSLGRVDDSLDMLYKALDRSPKIANARPHIAAAYYLKKNFAKACQWAHSAVENKDALRRQLLEDSCSRE